MKHIAYATLLLLLLASRGSAQSPATNLHLRVEPRTGAMDLVVDGIADSGAFFIYQACDLPGLLANPTVVVRTNTPLLSGLRFSLPTPTQAFFTAAHWPGRTVEEFGDPVLTNIAQELCLCGAFDMAFIPGGSFVMGDTLNDFGFSEVPVHTVQVGGFCMGKYEVTKTLWDEVYSWAVTNGYHFDHPGLGKAATHPVRQVNWYDVVKWCNARSEKEGRVPSYYTDAGRTTVYRSGQVDVQNDWVRWNNGYRLPTEAEWEKAARGGSSGHRFPWSDVDTITHAQANYYSTSNDQYDISPTRGYHPAFNDGVLPYTSPVGSFTANGYGLHDMTGNVCQWCWDWSGTYNSSSEESDPPGPATGGDRVWRGGSWASRAIQSRSAFRDRDIPFYFSDFLGFRVVLPLPQ